MNKLILVAALLSITLPVSAQQAWDKLSGNSVVAQAETAAAQDAAQWAALWAKHKGDTKAVAPAVDFSKEMVVAVFLGQKPTGGYKVELKTMPDPIDGARLVVFYKEVAPAKGGMQITVITRPFAMMKVAKSAQVVFEADGKYKIPESVGFRRGLTPEGRAHILDSVAAFSGFQFPR